MSREGMTVVRTTSHQEQPSSCPERGGSCRAHAHATPSSRTGRSTGRDSVPHHLHRWTCARHWQGSGPRRVCCRSCRSTRLTEQGARRETRSTHEVKRAGGTVLRGRRAGPDRAGRQEEDGLVPDTGRALGRAGSAAGRADPRA